MNDLETGALRVLDRPTVVSTPPKMPDVTVGCVDDRRSIRIRVDAGRRRRWVLSRSPCAHDTDRMTAEERAENRIFVGDHSGWADDCGAGRDGSKGIRRFGWGEARHELAAPTPRSDSRILLTQRAVTSPEPTEVVTDFWRAALRCVRA